MNKNMNTSSTTSTTSSIAAIWADVRHAQLRMVQRNRVSGANRTSR